jgi:hypothetical protein
MGSEQTTTPTRAEEVALGLEELAAWLRERPRLPVELAIAQVESVYASSPTASQQRFLDLASHFDEFTPQRGLFLDYCLCRKFTGGVEISLSCAKSILGSSGSWPEAVKALAPDADWDGAS